MSLPHSSSQRKTNLDSIQCAVLTGTGRSAIAVIGLRGPGATSIIARCFAPATPIALSIGQIRYGNWTGANADGAAGESVVVTPMGDNRFEIHCHGGTAAIARIVGDLRSCGAILLESTEWAEVDNLLVREAQHVLAQCLTKRTAAIAMDQVRGALVDWIHGWIDTLSEPVAIAAGLEIPRHGTAASAAGSLVEEARQIAARAPVTTRLSDPFRVVLIGPPNVGKSSLVNAMVGYDRSITFDEAGTTRDVLHADTIIDGIPIRLSDTAGIRESNEAIEREGVARAMMAAENADLILRVSSPDDEFAAESQILARPHLGQKGGGRRGSLPHDEARDLWGGDGLPIHISVFNKSDLLEPAQTPPAESISTNALTGDGIPELLQAVADHLARTMPASGSPAPLNTRQSGLLEQLAGSMDQDRSLRLLRELLEGPTCDTP